MFRKLFQKLLGGKKGDADPMVSLVKGMGIAPRDLGLAVVTVGDQSHQHQFVMVPWDSERFGSDFTDPDPDPGGPMAFPMATYKDLFRCQCGAEGIKTVRALI